MEKPCKKCHNLRAALGWSARPQVTEQGSGKVSHSAYADRLLNADFYPADKRPEECLGDWPVCPDCGKALKIDEPENDVGEDFDFDEPNFTNLWILLGVVFSAFLLLLFLS
jgi:hypothetical protein